MNFTQLFNILCGIFIMGFMEAVGLNKPLYVLVALFTMICVTLYFGSKDNPDAR